jgi:tRNA-specific 2-thiouridylase
VELETGRILGTHKGYWFHTIGQRKGLGLSQGPWFVVKKDIAENVVYVSHGYDPEAQYGNRVPLQDFRFITENPLGSLENGIPMKFKIRHTPEFTSGILSARGDYCRIDSEERIAGIAPGQFGVVYDLDERLCLGAGIIAETD